MDGGSVGSLVGFPRVEGRVGLGRKKRSGRVDKRVERSEKVDFLKERVNFTDRAIQYCL